MDIYGELMNRRQSQNFSISNNVKDSVLFMKALLVFTDFAPYLTKISENEKCFTEIYNTLFSENEKENQNFIADFNFEISKNAVFPWLNLMNSFSSMNDFQDDFYENIFYWFSKTQQKVD